ncbi:hypothetical protein [Ruegeria arenilitoris]|uniref:hypothetical protein n=1 Tax=Ruegeria arenilitoris TaxID=1173585 RepID=UPI00147B9529|nr:hypothetical protein [Ruegeria arenilitoris]
MVRLSHFPVFSKHFAIGMAFGAWAVAPQSITGAAIELLSPSAAYAQETEEVSPTKVRDRPREA